MRLIFVRHGEPDYTIDSLTEKGWKEAELLSHRMEKIKAKKCFVSPLGRAKDTASLSLRKMNTEWEELDFIREFSPTINRPDNKKEKKVAWDWLPEDWTSYEDFYTTDKWTNHPIFEEAGVGAEVEYIYSGFEKLLISLGYRKEGKLFKAEKPNNDTYVFFCHFGITCVLLGYLLNISPMCLWHSTCAAPTSLTIVNTEERRKGVASFRMAAFGDTSHLYAGDEPVSFAARFCECFGNNDERHD